MTKIENYPNAYKEVYVILNNMDRELIKMIPKQLINMIRANMNNTYNFKIKDNIDFQEQNLLKETKIILAYIFLNYWGTNEQKDKIKKKFRQDILVEEQSKAKYNMDNLFKNSELKKVNSNVTKNEMIVYKKENIFFRLINILKKILKI